MKQGSGIRGTAGSDLIIMPLDNTLAQSDLMLITDADIRQWIIPNEFALFYVNRAAAPFSMIRGKLGGSPCSCSSSSAHR